MKLFKKAKKGFTLVELVVVIAVIAILAGVSVGAYFGITDSANKSKLEQEAKIAWTSVRLAALANESHSSLDASGLHVYNESGFKNKVNFVSGVNYTIDTVLPDTLTGQAIILSESTQVSKTIDTSKTYKYFSYYNSTVSNKLGCEIDVLSGKTSIVGGNFETGEEVVDPSKITEILVSPKELTMVKGTTNFLEAKVLPVTAGNAVVEWSTSAESVVSVNQRGFLTAVGAGTATITAKVIQDGKEFSDTSIITVTNSLPTSITLDKDAISFIENSSESIPLSAIILPESANDAPITWKVEPEGIVNFSNGMVSVCENAVGEAKITAEVLSADGIISDSCSVSVVSTAIHAQYVQLNKHYITFNGTGDEPEELVVNVYPLNATPGTYTLEYDYDDNIISYNPQTKELKPKNVGTTKFKVTMYMSNVAISDTCEIEVLSTDILPTHVQFSANNISFVAQQEAQSLGIDVYPSDATPNRYRLEVLTSNDQVATYNKDTNKVESVGVGEAILTVNLYLRMPNQPERIISSDTCSVTVHQPVTGLEVLVNNVSGVSTINLDAKNDVTDSNGRVNSVDILPILKPFNATNKEAFTIVENDPNEVITLSETKDKITSTNNYGQATVTISANNLSVVLTVNVTKHITDILVKNQTVDFDENTEYSFGATVEPTNSSFTNNDISYTLNGHSITYLGNGLFKTIDKGITKVKAACDNIEKEFEITVEKRVTNITISDTKVTLNQNEMKQLTASITPNDASNTEVVWTIQNPDDNVVATISESGLLTGKSQGTATVKVSSKENSEIFKTCEVTVSDRSVSYTNYEYINTEAQFVSGEKYVIGYNNTVIMGNYDTSSNNYHYPEVSSNITVSNNVLNLSKLSTSSYSTFTIEKNDDGKYTIYDNKTNKFLGLSSSDNKIDSYNDASSDNAKWLLTFKDSYVEIQSAKYTNRYIKYNSSAKRFATYDGSQNIYYVRLYKQSGTPTLDPIITSIELQQSSTSIYKDQEITISLKNFEEVGASTPSLIFDWNNKDCVEKVTSKCNNTTLVLKATEICDEIIVTACVSGNTNIKKQCTFSIVSRPLIESFTLATDIDEIVVDGDPATISLDTYTENAEEPELIFDPSVDGVVNIEVLSKNSVKVYAINSSVGSVTISALVKGNESVTSSIQLTIKPKVKVSTVDFSSTLDDGDIINCYSYYDITINFNKGTNSNEAKFYANGNAVRIYAGGYFTVEANGGNITKIEFTFGSGDNINSITPESGTLSESVWTGNSKKIKFSIGGTKNHRRISKIKVYYN